MASRIITDKTERLEFIKKCAKKVKEEKERTAQLYDIDQETVTEVFIPDTDIISIEDISGFVTNGIQKIAGGLRKMPIIIL